jgi:hypothetical protein
MSMAVAPVLRVKSLAIRSYWLGVHFIELLLGLRGRPFL